jgi:hypothetical protein
MTEHHFDEAVDDATQREAVVVMKGECEALASCRETTGTLCPSAS